MDKRFILKYAMDVELHYKTTEQVAIKANADLEGVTLPKDRGNVEILTEQSTDGTVRIEGAAWHFSDPTHGEQVLFLRSGAEGRHCEGNELVDAVIRRAEKAGSALEGALEVIQDLYRQGVMISTYDHKWIPREIRENLDIAHEPREIDSLNTLHVLEVAKGAGDKYTVSCVERSEDVLKELHASDIRIPNPKGIICVLAHQKHLSKEHIASLIEDVFERAGVNIFGPTIGDDVRPRYVKSGMVFGMNDIYFLDGKLQEVPMEIAFQNNALGCVSNGPTSLFDEMATEVRGGMVHQTDVSGCGSLSCYILKKIFNRYERLIEYCDAETKRLERLSAGKVGIPKEKFLQHYEQLEGCVEKIHTQLENAEEVINALRQVAEVDRVIFGRRDPDTAVSLIRENIRDISTNLTELSHNLERLRESNSENSEKRVERKVDIIDKLMVALAGVIAVPIGADFLEKFVEQHNVTLGWSMLLASALFLGSCVYVGRVLKRGQ